MDLYMSESVCVVSLMCAMVCICVALYRAKA